MKKLLSAICLCLLLTFLGLFFFLPKSEAQDNVLQKLLDLPAPPPSNPLIDKRYKKDELFNKEPPADDAPLDVLLAYWEANNQIDSLNSYTKKPNERTLDRILEELEKNPESLIKYLNVLPTSQRYADFVKRQYDRELSDRKFGRDWREVVKNWLDYNSSAYSDELAGNAQTIEDTGEYVTNQESLIALAKVDWEKARPIVERLLNNTGQPVSQTLARWVAYQHATDEGNSIDAERYRKALQETVENKNAKPGNRDLAMDAIVKVGDFNGRDEWYFSLLEDETLYDLKVNGSSYTGLTTLLNMSPPEKYQAKMIELAGSGNPIIRNAAIKNLGTLINNGNPEVIKALLPWLENPKWATEINGERQRLVEQLRYKLIPESVSGLIFMLTEKAVREDVIYNDVANTAANSAPAVRPPNSNTSVERGKTVQVEYYPFRSSAVWALLMQKDMRAISALRGILPEVEEYERSNVVRAILECNGFSVPEQIQAIELVAKQMSKASVLNANLPANAVADGARSSLNTVVSAAAAINPPDVYYGSNKGYGEIRQFNPSEIPMMLGYQLMEEREVSEELITSTIERIKILEVKSPKIATIIRNIIKNWRGKGVNSLMLKDLKSGSIDINSVLKLLTLRKQLREQQNSEVYDIRGGSPLALGISACLLEDSGEYDALLNGDNLEAKTAMLGCSKLLRTVLPIQKVAENLKSPNKMLAVAAERYLESEDSPQSRQIILSIYPNEAKILGAKTLFTFTENFGEGYEQLNGLFASLSGDDAQEYAASVYFSNQDELIKTETKLQKEVKENTEIKGIYAYRKNFVRMYKDKAVFSWEEDEARYRERTLSKEELGNLTSYLSFNNVDELAPFNSYCDYCEGNELLMLGHQGGRRVFVRGNQKTKFFTELDQIFEDMRKPAAKLHYWLEKYVEGLEVLFEDEKLEAKTVWKTGDEVKLLVQDSTRRKQIEKDLEIQEENEDNKVPDDATDEYYQKQSESRVKRRKQKEYEEFSWYKFENNKLGAIIGQPSEVEFMPKKDNFDGQEGQWKARTANLEIRTDGTALYKISRGQTTKIKSGVYYNPVVTPSGNWVVATKVIEYEQILVRINLLTNKELILKVPTEVPTSNAEVFIPAINKMLIFSGYNYKSEDDGPESDEVEKDGDYFLLEVETGIFAPVKGEVKPLVQQTFRSLQPTANPNEFWAVISADNFTEFGRYDSKLLKFKPIIKMPEIKFTGVEMFVAENEAKIYFVYRGQLLRIPLPKEPLK